MRHLLNLDLSSTIKNKKINKNKADNLINFINQRRIKCY